MEKIKRLLIYLALAAILLIMVSCSSSEQGKYDTFAKALTEEGVKMYGTEWCSHCKSQKELFGTSFQYIDYVDCEKKADECNAAGLKGYPTWEIDGKLYPGEQSMADLAEYSGVDVVIDGKSGE